MSDNVIEELGKRLILRKRYKLKSVHREIVPTNYGMREGAHLIITHSTLGFNEMELPIYIALEEPALPISKSYLESGGIVVESLEGLGLNILDC